MSKLPPTAEPLLRFSGYDKHWMLGELGDYLSFKNGINADKESYGSGHKFINVLDIINNDFITHESIIGTVNVDKKTFEKNEVSYGDILFQRSSENREEAGQSNVYLDSVKTSCFGGFVIRGKAKRQYNPVYLNYLLKSHLARKEIVTKSGGSTRYNVGQDTLSEVKIYISEDKAEQQGIADFFFSVDKKISHLKEKHALLTQYKIGVMQKLFKQEIRFKDEKGNAFPDWQTKKLGDLFSHHNEKNGVSDNKLLSVKMNGGVVPRNEISGKDNSSDDKSKYLKVDVGDIVYNSMRMWQGASGLSNHSGIVSPAYTVITPNKNVDAKYFSFFFKHPNTINLFRRNSQGLTSDTWNLKFPLFSQIKVLVPHFEEQIKISSFLEALDIKIFAINEQVELTQNFKFGLLQQMFV